MKKLIIAFLAFIVITFSTISIIEYKNMVKNSNFEEMTPFSENNILLKFESEFQINENLPRIEAASAFYPFAANLVQNIYSPDTYSKGTLKLVSTSQAYEDILNKEADIVIATKPSEKQKEMIEKSNINLEFKTLYFEPLAILVNSKNKVDDLSIKQIQDIYYEKNMSWNTYQLEINNGSQTCFESIVKNNELGKNHHEINTMPKIVDKIALDKKGIGYAFYSYYSKMHKNTNAKVISVNNRNVEDSDYPLLFDVYLIYRTDNDNENISKIVNWLETEEGKELIYKIK